MPLTLIVITFGAFILFAAGSQLSRSTSHLTRFKTIASLQLIASNAIEIAAHDFIKESNLQMSDTWSGIIDFKDYVSSRGGIEGFHWQAFLSGLNENTYCRRMDLESYRSDISLGENTVDVEAYVYKIDKRYLAVAVAGRGGTKSYAVGLIAGLSSDRADASAFRLRTLGRELTVMNKANGNKITGDVVVGDVVVLDVVSLDFSLGNVPEDIIRGILSAEGISLSGGISMEDIEESFASWYKEMILTEEDKEDLVNQWKSDFYALFPEGAEDYTYYHGVDKTFSQSDYFFENEDGSIEDILITVKPGDEDNRKFTAAFDETGLDVYYEIMEPGSGQSGPTPVTKTFSFPAPTPPTVLNLMIEGDVEFIGRNKNTHMIDEIRGRYNIAVKGNIEISSNLVYYELKDYVNNGKGKSPVGNKSKEAAESVINRMIDDYYEGSYSWLNLGSIGGNIISNVSQSSHGNQTITAALYAFAEDGAGGFVDFPGLEDIKGKQTSQFYVLGSITATNLTSVDDLDSLVVVALTETDSDSESESSVRLALYGIQNW